MFRTSDCTYICPVSPPAFLAGAEEADSLLGMEPSVVVWSVLMVSGGVYTPAYFPGD